MPEETPKAAIAPGESFDISYGESGKTMSVVALSLSSQRKLAAIVKKLMVAESSGSPLEQLELFDGAEEAVRIAVPGITDAQLEMIDAALAIEIASKVLGKQSLSDDDKKKSE